jgi:hypothetical protein
LGFEKLNKVWLGFAVERMRGLLEETSLVIFGDATAAVWILTVADDLMVEALRPVKDGIATVAEVTEAMMKILLE